MRDDWAGAEPQASRAAVRESHGVPAVLELEDGTLFQGVSFGAPAETDGEVVFNTGMVGYVESLTDPSYRGQILALTFPLIGNYGVPAWRAGSERFESDAIQVRGLIVSGVCEATGHWEASLGLGAWLRQQRIVGLSGVDTRALTRVLRSRGTMLGRVHLGERGARGPFAVADPNARNLVAEVGRRGVETLGPGPPPARSAQQSRGTARRREPHVAVVDCGCKRSIVRELRARGCRVSLVPHDHDLGSIDCDGILVSNGPGDPAVCSETAGQLARAMARPRPVPIAGICLGSQIMALAAGGRTYKLPYGHRGQNQPVRDLITGRCLITSQNHGYAIEAGSLPPGWNVWHTNLNDGTVEGIRHDALPFLAVQFHPEGSPGPLDSAGFFDTFLGLLGDE